MTGVTPAPLHLGCESRTKVPQVEVPITGIIIWTAVFYWELKHS